MLSPPLDMQEKWFAPHLAYTMSKFGMSLIVLGLAGELRDKKIAVNALWPRTTIATAAIKNLLDDTFLTSEGVTNFEKYAMEAGVPLHPDFFVPDHL